MSIIEWCWNCGTQGEQKFRCVICDKDQGNCECPEPNFWAYQRCPECGASW